MYIFVNWPKKVCFMHLYMEFIMLSTYQCLCSSYICVSHFWVSFLPSFFVINVEFWI